MALANYQEDDNTLYLLNWIFVFVYVFPEYYKLKKNLSDHVITLYVEIHGDFFSFFTCLVVLMAVMFFVFLLIILTRVWIVFLSFVRGFSFKKNKNLQLLFNILTSNVVRNVIFKNVYTDCNKLLLSHYQCHR